MASKMKKTKKQRTHKTSPNTAGPARKLAQEKAHNHNNEMQHSPWEAQRIKRTAIRVAQGKPQAWAKRQADASKYKNRGKNRAVA